MNQILDVRFRVPFGLDHLVTCMNPGIRTTTALNLNRLTENCRQRLLQVALNRALIRLDLKTGKMSSQVGKFYEISQFLLFLANLRRNLQSIIHLQPFYGIL